MNKLTQLYIPLITAILILFMSGCELIVLRQPYTVIRLTDINQKSPTGLVMLVKRELDSMNTTAVLNLLVTPQLRPLNGIEKLSMLSSVQRLLQRSKGKELIVKDINFSQNQTSAVVKANFNHLEPIRFSVVKNEERWFVTSWE
jgi:hypothetical protein